MDVVPDWLQYGSFGVMVAVLFVVGRFGWQYFTGSVKHSRGMIAQANNRADKADARTDRIVESWESIVKENTAVTQASTHVQQATVKVMEEMCIEIRNGQKQSTREHAELRDALKDLARARGND